jgi:cysteine desulfurase
MDPIYLDHNATTPVLPEVVDAMLPYLREHFGNPSSTHIFGRRAHDALERGRAQVAALIGCDAEEVLFTSGGTESNNLAIVGTTQHSAHRRVVTSVIEHPATSSPVAWLEQQGWQIVRAGVDSSGRVQLAQIEAALGQPTALVTVMHSNNETGVLQPIKEVAAAAHRAGAVVHTDAAQSVGKVRIDVGDLGVDLLSLAGHKLYAPKGVGALYVRRQTPLRPLLRGAGHERGHRPGTENVAAIVALGVACEIAARDLDAEAERVRRLRERLWQRMAGEIPGLAINGHQEHRLPNTLNVRFPGVSGTALLDATPEIAASTQSACHAGVESASPVLLAMGLPVEEAGGAVRLTLGRSTRDSLVDQAAAALVRSWRGLLRRSGGGREWGSNPPGTG